MLTQTNDHQTVQIDFEMFTPEEYSDIHLFLLTELDNHNTDINTDVWDSRLHEDTQGYTEITSIDGTHIVELVIGRMIERFNTTTNYDNYSILFYKSQGQYNVNWHDDGSFVGAASIYLNKDWNRIFGGHFIYQMDHQQVMTAIQPKQGTAVYQSGGVLHATTPVSVSAPNRLSLQVFINGQ